MARCLIIGSGIVGLSTAYELKKNGFDITIIDDKKPDGRTCKSCPPIVSRKIAIISLSPFGLVCLEIIFLIASISPKGVVIIFSLGTPTKKPSPNPSLSVNDNAPWVFPWYAPSNLIRYFFSYP